MEREIKKACLVYGRWSGEKASRVSQELDLTAETLRYWQRQWTCRKLPAAGRGRQAEIATPPQREAVWADLTILGPGAGTPVLQGLHPHIARRELRAIQQAYRSEYCQTHCMVESLRWHRAGAVWAIDFTKVARRIDGIYKYVLCVRDLGSGDQLLYLPTTNKKGLTVYKALKRLLKQYCPPLVIKSDNGGEFVNAHVRELLWQKGVIFLLSPPGCPWYNGGCEAGIGSLKTRTHQIAARNDRPCEWTCDDVEAARELANRTARPKGHLGPTPQQMWERRVPISDQERMDFIFCLYRCRGEVMNEEEVLELSTTDKRTAARIDRNSIARALCRRGFLSTRRRRIYSPVFPKFCGKIA